MRHHPTRKRADFRLVILREMKCRISSMKGKQEGATQAACAPSSTDLEGRTWQQQPWKQYEEEVRRLQVRIAKAQKEGKYGKVKCLQYILVHSKAARFLAVKRVSQNKGSRTAGVDKVTWRKDAVKLKATESLTKRGYRPLPLKRVLIPKMNGKMRPLGIPTMKDRAMQALYLMAYEPVTETTADGNSYGFRRYRGCHDAIDAIFKIYNASHRAKYVLEGDIKGCFDHISHEWMLDHIQMDKEVLGKWLKSGYLFKGVFTRTREGTPQGGIISPTLANATLDGMEGLLGKYRNVKKDGKSVSQKVHFVRYADDFIVSADNREVLMQIKEDIKTFLKERGLELSDEKTLITHINDGFDFLGFNIRKFNGTLLIRPSKKAQKRFADNTHEVIFGNKTAREQQIIDELNPKLTGWGNYFKVGASKEVFAKMDHLLLWQLKRWCNRRHHNKSLSWIKAKYFIRRGNRDCGYKINDKSFYLRSLADIPIERHIKIKSKANPFDPDWDEYFEQRREWKRRRRQRKGQTKAA